MLLVTGGQIVSAQPFRRGGTIRRFRRCGIGLRTRVSHSHCVEITGNMGCGTIACAPSPIHHSSNSWSMQPDQVSAYAR